jgi:hypothetical protein
VYEKNDRNLPVRDRANDRWLGVSIPQVTNPRELVCVMHMR